MEQDELYRLIEECGLNKREAQEAVYKHFYEDMFVTCKRYTEEAHDALTILNDGFLKAFMNISKYKNELGNFRSWLKTIIINTAIDHTRRIKKEAHIIHIDNVPEYNNSEFQLSFIYREDVSRHLQLLPPVTRAVINLFAFDGYDYREIAERLAITESTCRWHVGEARKRLRQSMQLQKSKD